MKPYQVQLDLAIADAKLGFNVIILAHKNVNECKRYIKMFGNLPNLKLLSGKDLDDYQVSSGGYKIYMIANIKPANSTFSASSKIDISIPQNTKVTLSRGST